MPPGARALGFAESYRDPPGGRASRSTLAGTVLRRDRTLDGVVFGSCTVGGTDATASIVDCWERLDRPDVGHVLLAGIAPAWFNLVDVRALQDAIQRPVIAVGFEASEGLSDAIARAFEGTEREERLDTYRRQPDRVPVSVGAEPDGTEATLYCRFVGIDSGDGREVVRAHTAPASGRPEPLRVARLVARAGDSWRRSDPPCGDGVGDSERKES